VQSNNRRKKSTNEESTLFHIHHQTTTGSGSSCMPKSLVHTGLYGFGQSHHLATCAGAVTVPFVDDDQCLFVIHRCIAN
jgi:hypothetical protein